MDAMNSEGPVVSVKNLKKFYSSRSRSRMGVLAVESIDFEIRQGQCLGIVGESGSGKTTIAKMLLGIEAPTDGMIEVAGRERSIAARGSGEGGVPLRRCARVGPECCWPRQPTDRQQPCAWPGAESQVIIKCCSSGDPS